MTLQWNDQSAEDVVGKGAIERERDTHYKSINRKLIVVDSR